MGVVMVCGVFFFYFLGAFGILSSSLVEDEGSVTVCISVCVCVHVFNPFKIFFRGEAEELCLLPPLGGGSMWWCFIWCCCCWFYRSWCWLWSEP